MVNLSRLEKVCPDGIPFSKCKEYLEKQRKKAKTKRIKKSSPKKKRRTRSRPYKQKIPPKGVIIRKKGKLYRSDGKSLKSLVDKKIR